MFFFIKKKHYKKQLVCFLLIAYFSKYAYDLDILIGIRVQFTVQILVQDLRIVVVFRSLKKLFTSTTSILFSGSR